MDDPAGAQGAPATPPRESKPAKERQPGIVQPMPPRPLTQE
jgi:hypothetical protein